MTTTSRLQFLSWSRASSCALALASGRNSGSSTPGTGVGGEGIGKSNVEDLQKSLAEMKQ